MYIDFGFPYVKYLAAVSVHVNIYGTCPKGPVVPDANGHLFSSVWDISTGCITVLCSADDKNWHTRYMLA